ncbi:MAG: tRNA 2-thiouridine(34) synthase MnmA [Lachnospiraceae bacterium]|nr:tRNA 2-thiouridine(34) synthase MnmA [Lachnospiraceae bacterium]
MSKKVVVGMSGGVDSSVCAWLLKEQGYDVTGATMEIWQDNPEKTEKEGGCCGLSAVDDARRVAECLDIPYYVMNFRETFKEKVIDEFTASYLKGVTPNPCILCNRFVKWEAFLARCMEIGADYIATGHYAQVVKLENGRYTIKKAVSRSKDQSYVLYSLSQFELAHTLMPVGTYEKPEIRGIAEKTGLPVAHKKDSQDICFIEDGDYAGFIEKETGSHGTDGVFKDLRGNVLGKHSGTARYTIGQRKGLDIALGHRAYVCDIDAESGDVLLGSNEDLFTTEVYAADINYMGEENFDENELYTAKIRYSQENVPVRVKYVSKDVICLTFEKPVRAATPGQAAVVYKDDWIVGGGTIIKRR